jgi:hypothetical protein
LAWHPVLAALLVALLLIAGAGVGRRSAATPAREDGSRLAALLVAASVSFVVVVWALGSIHVARPPFVRTALFVPLFLWTALVLVVERSTTFFRRAALLVVAVNALLGARVLVTSFIWPNADPLLFPGLSELSAVPVRRLMELHRRLPLSGLEARPSALPVMELYARTLSVPLKETNGASGPCAYGSHPPIADASIWVIGDGERSMVCF